MPVYCYTSADGQTSIERVYQFGKAPAVIRVRGKRFHRDFRLEQVGVRPPGNWPFACEALAVNPEDVSEAHADAVKSGVPTDFNTDGAPIMRSPEHMKQFCRAYGFYHRNAGYSDAAPVNR